MDFVPTMSKSSRLWKSKADFFRPFRTAAAEAGENIAPLYDPSLHHAVSEEQQPAELRELNIALAALADIFPNVEPEVFREMLLNVSRESRVEIVTECLLQNKKEKGRGRKLQKARPAETVKPSVIKGNLHVEAALAIEVTFRSEEYKQAVKQVFYQEFRPLSHSTIKGVMAEHNYSYTTSRPVLQQLSSKTWRFSFAGLFPRRTQSGLANDHPFIHWSASSGDEVTTPAIRRTGSSELDKELHELFVEPVVAKQRRELLATDHAYAHQVNETIAEEAEALFDCECCYGSVPFERISHCNAEAHQLCFDCIQQTVKEALYGQGWARTADLEKSTVRCFAPSLQECHGCLPAQVVRRALSDGDGTQDVWNEFQSRLETDTLTKSRMRLQRCPFCNYAEIDETPTLKMKSGKAIWHHIATKTSAAAQIMLLSFFAAIVIFTIPLLLVVSLLWLTIHIFPPAASVLDNSWTRVYKRRRGPKFKCRKPECSKVSCTRCMEAWRDPHVCFETEKTSLRTAIESSATAAIKRTCPKCLLSFVKSSGCNKLVCNCGYTMCYVCRQEITSKEGYAHFCQHFRPSGGRCGECERCDLYGDEDEELAIRRAAEAAEIAWREEEGGKGQSGTDERTAQLLVEALVGQAKHRRRWEEWLDVVVEAIAS